MSIPFVDVRNVYGKMGAYQNITPECVSFSYAGCSIYIPERSWLLSDVEVLYHSDLSFSDRMYGPLDVDVCRIKLHEPLSIIVQQPLLYVRDMVPKACFEALVKLEEVRSFYRF